MQRFQIAGGPIVVQVPTPDLGDHSYAAIVGDRAVVIDPQRDVERMLAAVGDARIVAVFETHIHNDYVTGGHLLAAECDAAYVLPAETGATVSHTAIAHGEEFPIADGWALLAVHTPGHTFHHTSYQLIGPDGPAAVFSGGSMLVGAVGRSDLLGDEHTDALVRLQFRSVRHLADTTADPALVAPTHGAGSFCSASQVLDTTSTIERERTRNPALLDDDEDRFARSQVAGYRLHPVYYAHMGPANLIGVAPVDDAPLQEMSPVGLDASGAEVIDLRTTPEWAAGHIPGSLCVPAREDTAQYIGWVLPWNREIVLVGSAEQVAMARLQLARIGYDAVVGAVTDGLRSWTAEGRGLMSVRVAGFEDVVAERPQVLMDVRDPLEYSDSHIPGAVGMHVSRFAAEQAPGEDGGDVWLYCASGFRATVAAGFVRRTGSTPVIVHDDWDTRGRVTAAALESGDTR